MPINDMFDPNNPVRRAQLDTQRRMAEERERERRRQQELARQAAEQAAALGRKQTQDAIDRANKSFSDQMTRSRDASAEPDALTKLKRSRSKRSFLDQ